WFTNLDHGRRHQPLPLMTMADNLKFSKHKQIRGKTSYDHYDNYDAIEVPFTDAIPSDYDGVMGVPISFLDKRSPDQFEIIGSNRGIDQDPKGIYGRSSYINGKETFKRIFIRHGKKQNEYKSKN
ncbi:MAG: adenine-specific methyltransferase EcoRI family protein, partial [Anaerolineaceae bacterium]|nr:adenine-specific methyltransferase EcoRI family protein [Anaerolineaceae bacterium]